MTKPVEVEHGLNGNQLKFCQEFMKDFNASRAYREAGYKAKSENSVNSGASQLLRNPKVQKYLSELKRQKVDHMEKQALVTVEDVIKDFIKIKQRCMQEEPVMQKQDGELVETGEYKFDSSGANKANDSLARHLGMYNDKIEHSGSMRIEDYLLQRKKEDE